MNEAAPPPGAPLEQLTEDELVTRARAAMARAVAAPQSSIGRAIQWAVYDTVMAELDRRAIALVASGSAPGEALRELRAMLAASPRRRDGPVAGNAATPGHGAHGGPPALSPGAGGPR